MSFESSGVKVSGEASRGRVRGRSMRGLCVAWLAAGLTLLMTSAQAGVVGGEASFELPEQQGFPSATYYRVTRLDPRLCPSPLCGGVFVSRVNRKKTECAAGESASECHAAIVDFSALGLTPEEETRLQAEFVAKRVLARGELVLVDRGIGVDVPTLVVRDAWRGVTGSQRDRGRYFGVFSTGIVCITHPCPSFSGFKLNGRRVGWIHGLDLASSGATDPQIAEGMEALFSGPGLLAFGRLRTIEGPAGKGKELVTSEFYTRVASDGGGGGGAQACGGFTYPPNPSCDAGEFCEQPAGTCYVADLPGTCQPIPDVCLAVVDPVCGCDGRTYGNDCERQRAQVALDHRGVCEPGRAD